MGDPIVSVDSTDQTIPATDPTTEAPAGPEQTPSMGAEVAPPSEPRLDPESIRLFLDRIREKNPNGPLNTVWNPQLVGDADSFPITYAQSIIRSDDYSDIADHRPVELAVYPKAGKRFPKDALVVYPGFNRVTGNGAALTTELLPLGERPSVPFVVDLHDPKLALDTTDPLYPMIEAASRESDLLDAVAAMVRWLKERVVYKLNDDGRSPEEVLAAGWGDCDDMSLILQQGCELLGIEGEMTGGAMYDASYHGIRGWTRHAWNMIKVEDRWIPVDVTMGIEGSPDDGDHLWEMAVKTFWVPFSDAAMKQWRQIEAIKPAENLAYIDFDENSFEWNGVGDLVEKMRMPPSELRAYLVDQNLLYLLSEFEGDAFAYQITIPEEAARAHATQYQKIYLDIVIAQWLQRPEIIVDPLAGLDHLRSLLQSEGWSPDIRESYGLLGLVLLTFALADAESQRLESHNITPINPIRPDELYKTYQEWIPFLPERKGYAGLVQDEWEKRLRALHEWDSQTAPEDLAAGRPEYGHFPEAIQFVKEGQTPEELRRRTLDYTAARKDGIPDLAADAVLLESWVADGELKGATGDDLALLRRLFEVMKQNQGDDQNTGEGAFQAFRFMLQFSDRGGMSILGQVYLRDIFTRELNRRLTALADNPDKTQMLQEALQAAEFLSQSQLNQRVIAEARPLMDHQEAVDSTSESEIRSFQMSTRLMPTKLGFDVNVSPQEAQDRLARRIAERNNEASVQESRLVSLDEESFKRCQESLAQLDLIAQKISEIASQLPADSPDRVWCEEWLARYSALTK